MSFFAYFLISASSSFNLSCFPHISFSECLNDYVELLFYRGNFMTQVFCLFCFECVYGYVFWSYFFLICFSVSFSDQCLFVSFFLPTVLYVSSSCFSSTSSSSSLFMFGSGEFQASRNSPYESRLYFRLDTSSCNRGRS